MARRITDDRIGIRDENMSITKKPTKYSNGSAVHPQERPTTIVWFGEDGQYFYYVPIGVRSTEQLKEQMKAIVGAGNDSSVEEQSMPEVNDVETPPVTSKRKIRKTSRTLSEEE